jgi:hypothetical protein
MSKRSNKSIAETLSPTESPLLDVNYNDKHLALLERKIALATEGFTTHKLCELILKDRNRTSEENALTMCDYIIAMKRKVNPRLNYKRNTMQVLSGLSIAVGIQKKKLIDIDMR